VTVDYFINVDAPSLQTLTVSKAGNGSGTITSTPAGIDCGSTCSASFAQGTVVTLAAIAGDGMNFNGWSGADGCPASSEDSCQVTMDQARTVIATFDSFQSGGGQKKVYMPVVRK
jgi:hypothetical protein